MEIKYFHTSGHADSFTIMELIENRKDTSILQDPIIYNKAFFKELCKKSDFVIMGFIKGFLMNEAESLIQNIDRYNKNKKISVYSGANKIPYHPIVWIKLNGGQPFKDIVASLKEII